MPSYNSAVTCSAVRESRISRHFAKHDPDQPMPRLLLIIDEFQEFFVKDDKIAHDAGLLLDRLVRQGRAFGIHVLLGSQTLGRRVLTGPQHTRTNGSPHRSAVQ